MADHLVLKDAIDRKSGESRRVRIPLTILNMASAAFGLLTATIQAPVEQLELATVIKVSEAVSSEIVRHSGGAAGGAAAHSAPFSASSSVA